MVCNDGGKGEIPLLCKRGCWLCRLNELKAAALFSTIRVQWRMSEGERVTGPADWAVRVHLKPGRMQAVASCACLRGAWLCAHLTL